MTSSLRHTLDFLLYQWLEAETLQQRSSFSDHSRETFDAVLDTSERIAREKYAPFNRLVDLEEPRTETEPDGTLRVVLPQAVKRMIPAFMERSIELMKTTTLVATVAYADLLFQANELAQKTFRPLEVFTVTALIYFVVIYFASLVVHRIERRLAVSGETTVH